MVADVQEPVRFVVLLVDLRGHQEEGQERQQENHIAEVAPVWTNKYS